MPWSFELRRYASTSFRAFVMTLLLIRRFEHSSILSLVPNELLFQILVHVPITWSSRSKAQPISVASKRKCLVS